MKRKNTKYKLHEDTLLATLGRPKKEDFGTVNTPVSRASTITFKSLQKFLDADARSIKKLASPSARAFSYGRSSNSTTLSLRNAINNLENAYATLLTNSGLSAITTTLLSLLKSGDHLLVSDSVYNPVKKSCDYFFTRLNIETTYYNPLIGSGIKKLFKKNTKVVFMESPGSLTFDMIDIPAIVKESKKSNIKTVVDNTWATPLLFRPLDYDVDVSLMAITKYVSGHADIMMGSIAVNKKSWKEVASGYLSLANAVSPDDAYLSLRGLRTMGIRLKQHQKNAKIVANWLKKHPLVTKIMYPALPSDLGYKIWKKYYNGASGLFGFVIKPCPVRKIQAMLASLDHFSMGFSWGGYESLLIPTNIQATRNVTKWSTNGNSFRIHIGLEDPNDLIQDLKKGFNKLK